MNKIAINTLILLFLLGLPQLVFGQLKISRESKMQFAVEPETRIELTNKYGKIEMNTWKKDSIAITIEIKVEDKKLSRLEKSMESIDFDITNNRHFVVVKTVVGGNMGTLSKEFIKLKETVLQTGGNMEINYTVWLPNTNNLKVENKFGDVSIGDYEGEVEINLSNGNLNAHDFTGKTNLILSFADATINQMNSGTFNCNYGDVEIEKAESLKIVSKSSDFEIDEIANLETDSRRDKFQLQLAENIDAVGNFSNFTLEKLINRATLRVEYGDIEIESVDPGFSSIYIESKSADIDLSFSKDSKFKFDITNTKSETTFCNEISIANEEMINEQEGKVRLFGNFGAESENEKLNINAVGGGIVIQTE
ncbi:MAG: DUF4097 family beta strand repeat protein [Prolixibacteraceae bacterium]|nr:DUF4097 family beta strand repeat protein [Prolixibacteraceae bacterium]